MRNTKTVRRSNGDQVVIRKVKGHTITFDRKGNILGVKAVKA